jgi:hypothetical protein
MMTMLATEGDHIELKPDGWEHFSGAPKRRKNRLH